MSGVCFELGNVIGSTCGASIRHFRQRTRSLIERLLYRRSRLTFIADGQGWCSRNVQADVQVRDRVQVRLTRSGGACRSLARHIHHGRESRLVTNLAVTRKSSFAEDKVHVLPSVGYKSIYILLQRLLGFLYTKNHRRHVGHCDKVNVAT